MGWSDFSNDQPSLWESMTHDIETVQERARREKIEKLKAQIRGRGSSSTRNSG